MDKIFKLLLSAALLLCCIMLNAQQPTGDGSQDKTPLSIDNVAYIDADGVEQTVTATVITDETGTLSAGWYVVTDSNVQTGTLVCNGAVHLILADDAKLTATGLDYVAGITVSGDGNSLTIYGQATQSGQLIANGGYWGAGIGGGSENSSDIYVATNLVVKADRNNPPTEVIYNNGSDLASTLSSKIYVTIDPGSLDKVKTDAIAAINAAIEGVTDETILAIANKAKTDINAAETVQHVISIKATALAQMNALTLAIARADAIGAVQAAATDAKTAIDTASSYKAADAIKLDYKAKIDLVIEAATDAINNEASTTAMVDELRDKAMSQINGRKEEALTAIAKINEFEDAKVQAIADITNARQGIQNENLNKWIDGAIKDIQNGGPDATPGIDEIKEEVLNLISFFKEGKAEGKAEGLEEGKAAEKAELLGNMGVPYDDCTAVEVTDGTTTVKLYNPEKVSYIKVKSKE